MQIKVLDIDKDVLKEAIKLQGEKRFYVYIHRKISDNTPFYIGKGTKYRCTDKTGRSKYWFRVAEKYGVYVQIYKYGITSEEACNLEKEIIKKVGLKKLSNISQGGENGLVGKLNHMYGVRLLKEKNGNYMNRGFLNPLSKPVLCFDLNGNFIKEYASLQETLIDGFLPQCISRVCNGKAKQHKGFFFVKKSDYKNQIYKEGKTSRKKVLCFDIEDNFIKEYNSVSKTKEDGFCPKKVSAVCLGKRKTHKKHKWQYKI